MMATREERNNFSNMILQRAENLNTDHLDAMVTYCDEMNIEVEIAAGLINDVLRTRLEEDAQELRYIPRSSRLPI